MNSEPATPSKKLYGIQVLRAVAAALVVCSHLEKEIPPGNGGALEFLQGIRIAGQFGVDIFFIISGFIMIYVTRRTKHSAGEGALFFVKRIIRVVPLYWTMTALTIVMSLTFPDAKNHNDMGILYILSSFAFFPIVRSDGHFTPALGVGWTLNYEMMFYLVFAICLAVPWRRASTILTVAFIAIIGVGFLVGDNRSALWFWTRPTIFEFLAGVWIAEAYIGGGRIRPPFALGACIFAIFIWLGVQVIGIDPIDSGIRWIVWGGPAALIVGAVVLYQSDGKLDSEPTGLVRFFSRLGDSSYSLYLCHMFVIRLVSRTVAHYLGGMAYVVILYALGLSAAAFVAYNLYKFLELPLDKYGNQLLSSAIKSRQQVSKSS